MVHPVYDKFQVIVLSFVCLSVLLCFAFPFLTQQAKKVGKKSDLETEVEQPASKLKVLVKGFSDLIFAGNCERRPWRVVQENEPQQIPVHERSYYKTLARLEACGKAT